MITKTSQIREGRAVRVRFEDAGILDGIVTNVLEPHHCYRWNREADVYFPAFRETWTVHFDQIEKVGPYINIPTF